MSEANQQLPSDASATLPPRILHTFLVERAAEWLRAKSYPIVVTEIASGAGESPDAIGWKGVQSALIECKISRSDFAADSRKPWRRFEDHGMGDHRYFLTPSGLIEPDKVPAKWGLLVWDGKRVRKIKDAEYSGASKRKEVALLVSLVRRIGQSAPKGVSIRCYTFETKCRASCGLACDTQWTRERPTDPGWYWHRSGDCNDEGDAVYLERCSDGQLVALGWGTDYNERPIEQLAGEWAGPIPAPAGTRA